MKMLSEKFVLITVFLQLCFSAHDVKAYQFGDLLEFPTPQIAGRPGYKHYAVYVDGETVEGKDAGQNIFEMIRKPKSGCRFVKKEEPFTVNNYLDGKHTPQTTENMIKTIQELMKSDICKDYNLLTGNCEHIATMVRYGQRFCNQSGTRVETLARLTGVGRKKKRREASAAA